MGILNNIGGALLDVQQGMEYAKANERRDADWQRNQKRADMQDQVAGYGLEDLQRTRADKASERAAVAGSDGTIRGAADAASKARIAAGDVVGAEQAKNIKVEDAKKDFEAAQTEFQTKLLPLQQKIAQNSLQGQADRQPGMEMLASADLQEKTNAAQERMLARAWQVANVDKGSAIKMLSDSPVLFQGKGITDILKSKDGQRLVFLGEDGNPIAGQDGKPLMINTAYLDQLAAKYGDPGKTFEVEKDKRLVHVTAGGQAKEIYKAPDKVVPGKYIKTDAGTVLDTHTGQESPGLASAGPSKRSEATAAHQDTRVKVAMDYIGKALGGTFDALGQISLPPGTQDVYRKVGPRAEELVKGGMDPLKAGQQALEEINRQSTLAKVGAAPAQVGATPTNNAAKLADWKQYQPVPQ